MALKYRVVANGQAILAEDSKDRLLAILQTESEEWSFFDEFSTESYPNVGAAQFIEHDTLIEIIRDDTRTPNEEDDTDIESENIDFEAIILPLSHSPEGLVLFDLFEKGQMKEFQSVLMAYFHEMKPQFIPDNLRNLSVLKPLTVGSAIIWGARSAEIAKKLTVSGAAASKEVQVAKSYVKKVEDELNSARSASDATNDALLDAKTNIHAGKTLFRKAYLKARRIDRSIVEKWDSAFDSTHSAYFEKLKFEAPVTLWGERAAAHVENASKARALYWCILLLLAVTSVSFLVGSGEWFANLFTMETCSNVDGDVLCEKQFSARGPLAVGTAFLITTLALWVLRLQNKVYLSERHLALDASERKAFVETYLAMNADQSIPEEHRAIMMHSVFRPTQDGIVKDDDGAPDLAAMAIVAKALNRNG